MANVLPAATGSGMAHQFKPSRVMTCPHTTQSQQVPMIQRGVKPPQSKSPYFQRPSGPIPSSSGSSPPAGGSWGLWWWWCGWAWTSTTAISGSLSTAVKRCFCAVKRCFYAQGKQNTKLVREPNLNSFHSFDRKQNQWIAVVTLLCDCHLPNYTVGNFKGVGSNQLGLPLKIIA